MHLLTLTLTAVRFLFLVLQRGLLRVLSQAPHEGLTTSTLRELKTVLMPVRMEGAFHAAGLVAMSEVLAKVMRDAMAGDSRDALTGATTPATTAVNEAARRLASVV